MAVAGKVFTISSSSQEQPATQQSVPHTTQLAMCSCPRRVDQEPPTLLSYNLKAGKVFVGNNHKIIREFPPSSG